MNTACAAPRLRASMPTAPVPAKMSRKREPEILGARTLKRVSRRRSLVGRRALPLRDFKMRLRYLPAITRICLRKVREKNLTQRARRSEPVCADRHREPGREPARCMGKAAGCVDLPATGGLRPAQQVHRTAGFVLVGHAAKAAARPPHSKRI